MMKLAVFITLLLPLLTSANPSPFVGFRDDTLNVQERAEPATCRRFRGPDICFDGCEEGQARYKMGSCQGIADIAKAFGCSVNQTFDGCGGGNCASTSCEYGVYRAGQRQKRDVCTCIPGCQCKEGYYKNKDGRCVALADCPPLPTCPSANMTWDPCSHCDDPQCDFITLPPRPRRSQIPPPPIHCFPFMCRKGCYCKPGYVRTTPGGACVRLEDCPHPQCGEGEVFLRCGNECRESKCGEDADKPKICTSACHVGCFCQHGWKRNSGGQCVQTC